MLELKNITKKYVAGDTETAALDNVSLAFGEREFVAILGTSGSGKTTMLNVIGGLDRYDGGDLIINGTSTEEYKSRDWDTYRNHSIGFVFQSYNLIPHQSVLSNVELALTLSGVPKAERRRRAKEALTRVGLGDQLKKKPSQMSGGQMQRVAIARAIVNNPDILLADEPTGALDTETSVQIMEILREISKDKLIIMVTHNPDLAKSYATRIVRLSDGRVLSDEANVPDAPTSGTEQTVSVGDALKSAPDRRKKRSSMSALTAFSLSLNNLMTKKARTILTSFAGSIGIIGIALILAISSGIQAYINRVQEDTLSGYPVTIQAENVDLGDMLSTFMGQTEAGDHGLDRVYSSPQLYDMFDSLANMESSSNNLKDFKAFLDENTEIYDYAGAIQYSYNLDMLIYGYDAAGSFVKINPSTIVDSMRSAMGVNVSYDEGGSGSVSPMSMMQSMSGSGGMQIWTEIMPDRDGEGINDLVRGQYDVVSGSWPESYDQVVLVVDANNEISDVYLYSLGLEDQSELEDIISKAASGDGSQSEDDSKLHSWSYDDLVGMNFYCVLPTECYNDSNGDGVWEDMTENSDYMKITAESGIKLTVSGIVRPVEDAAATSITGAVGYTADLTDYIINQTNDSMIVTAQKDNPDTDVFSGLPFDNGEGESITDSEKAESFRTYASSLSDDEKAELYKKIIGTIPAAQLTAAADEYMSAFTDRASMEDAVVNGYVMSSGADAETVKGYISSMSDEDLTSVLRGSAEDAIAAQYAEAAEKPLAGIGTEQLVAMLDAAVKAADEAALADYCDSFMPSGYSDSTYEQNLEKLNAVDIDSPSAVNIYAQSFDAKDSIAELISEYNEGVDEVDRITYTDYVALLMSSITTIINAISYVLIAFVSISLVVSSIMIGIITYISVLERTKEIGILRSIGASKRDVSRVFNAETLIVGLISGLIGIGLTLLACIPINLIIKNLTDISGVAALPWQGAVILIAISMLLTIISGLIPSKLAAKKDPVAALRSE